MPKIDTSTSSATNFYTNQDQCQTKPGDATSSAVSPSAASSTPAAAATSPNELSYDGAYEAVGAGLAYDGLLQKYASDLSAFRRSNQQPEPQASTVSVTAHDPVACNEAKEAVALNCLDAAANVLHAVAALKTPGIDTLATGMQVTTSAIRCGESILEASKACTDKLAPQHTATPQTVTP